MSNITINDQDFSRFVHYPYNFQLTLNETLDTAMVTLLPMRQSAPFRPFSRVSLDGRDFVLAVDEVSEMIGRGAFSHTLTLIESTKILERYIVTGKKFTNPLTKEYKPENVFGNYYDEQPGQQPSPRNRFKTGTAVSPKTTGGVSIPSLATAMSNNHGGESVVGVGAYYTEHGISMADIMQRLQYDSGALEMTVDGLYEFIPIYKESTPGDTAPASRVFTATFNKAGVYKIVYYMHESGEATGLFAACTKFFEFDMAIVENQESANVYTIADTIETLLETLEPIRVNNQNAMIDSPRFRLLDPTISELQKRSPELYFAPGRTLWECLSMIGEYIHAIPRLVQGNAITFDFLGGTEKADFSKGRKIANKETYSADDYTETLTATFSNMVEQDDASGVISDPGPNTAKTLRTASETARIQEGDSFIETAFPIQQLKKVEAIIIEDDEYRTVDITPYVFERSEYQTLGGTSGAYPFAKNHALCYTIGQPNIEGLWFKAETATPWATLKERYAITNVLNMATGNDWSDYSSDFGSYIDSVMFRVTYVPLVNGMINAKKNTYDGTEPLALVFNQSANKMSARAFGESLKGRLAMLGTTEKRMTYLYKSAQDIQRPGLLDGRDYVGSVTVQANRDYCVAEYVMTTGYNKLGAFVNVDNEFRMYNIPDETDRFIMLDDYCNVSEERPTNPERGNDSIAGLGVRTMIANSLKSNGVNYFADSFFLRTYRKDGTEITNGGVYVPCLTLGIGNSFAAIAKPLNNVSAGSKAVYINDSEIKYDYQEDVTITDGFGRAEYMDVSLVRSYTEDGESIDAAQAYPQWTEATNYANIATTRIALKKDAGDNVRLVYQLHFVSDNGIILGSELARRLLVCENTRSQSSLILRYYEGELDELTGNTTSMAVGGASIPSTTLENGVVKIVLGPATGENIPHKSWALYLNRDGDESFVFGKNTTQLFNNLYLEITHKRKEENA